MSTYQNDDTQSVSSANTREQLSFWSLTVSFMLKLIALGVTLFALPYNEWIILKNNDYLIMRGISKSDCIRDLTENGEIDCIHWTDTQAGTREEFWSLRLIISSNVEYPSLAYRTLYYVMLVQLIVYLIDMAATLIMCCRYRNADTKNNERRFAVICYISMLSLYLFVTTIMLANSKDFIHTSPPLEACLGNAFRLFLAAILLYHLSSVLIFYTEFYRRAIDNDDAEKSVVQNLQILFRELLPKSKYEPASSKT